MAQDSKCPQLSEKQRKFVEEYLIDLNGTQAAIRAGYSPKTAYSMGNENLRKPDIQIELKKAIEKMSQQTEVTVARVINELAKIAFASSADVFNGFEIRMSDKNKALELLGKYLAMFTDNINLNNDQEIKVSFKEYNDE